jgi:hypothetical protein
MPYRRSSSVQQQSVPSGALCHVRLCCCDFARAAAHSAASASAPIFIARLARNTLMPRALASCLAKSLNVIFVILSLSRIVDHVGHRLNLLRRRLVVLLHHGHLLVANLSTCASPPVAAVLCANHTSQFVFDFKSGHVSILAWFRTEQTPQSLPPASLAHWVTLDAIRSAPHAIVAWFWMVRDTDFNGLVGTTRQQVMAASSRVILGNVPPRSDEQLANECSTPQRCASCRFDCARYSGHGSFLFTRGVHSQYVYYRL